MSSVETTRYCNTHCGELNKHLCQQVGTEQLCCHIIIPAECVALWGKPEQAVGVSNRWTGTWNGTVIVHM